jgi:hypothetical protein
VPKAAFVDARDFSDFGSLEKFIRAMSPDAAGEYVAAASVFMMSKKAEVLSQAHFVRTMAAVLLQATQ